MKRFHIFLEDSQPAALKKIAAKTRRVTVGEHIRRAIDAYIAMNALARPDK